ELAKVSLRRPRRQSAAAPCDRPPPSAPRGARPPEQTGQRCSRPSYQTRMLLLDANVPRLLKVVFRVCPECGESLGPLNAGHGWKDLRDDVRDVVVLRHAHDGHEVPLA